jgi:hypothetical protein
MSNDIVTNIAVKIIIEQLKILLPFISIDLAIKPKIIALKHWKKYNS